MIEPYAAMQTAAALFGAAALGGLLMAGMRFRGIARPPAWLAMAHGLLAAAGLTLLIYAAATTGIPKTAQLALALLVTAALGGVAINLLFDQKSLALPKALMTVHALLALAGFTFLLICIYAQPHVA